MLSGGGAVGEREPGGGGDVFDAADVDGADQGAGGRGRGPVVRADESGDAADGGGPGVGAFRGTVSGGDKGGKAGVGGARGGWGGAVEFGDVAGGEHVCVARHFGAVYGGASAGGGLGEDWALGGHLGDGVEGGGSSWDRAGGEPPGSGEFGVVRGRVGAGR